LFNEWFSFHVLEALQVPQPRCAIVLAPVWGTTERKLAFVSCEASPINYGTPKQRYRIDRLDQCHALARRLLGGVKLPSLIAVDQLIANIDRNLGNLVFIGQDSFVAIDHGHALHGPAWQWDALWKTQRPTPSPLLSFLVAVLGDLPDGTANAMVAAAEIMQEQYYAMQDSIREAVGSQSSALSAAAMDMTWWRCDRLSDWFKAELQTI